MNVYCRESAGWSRIIFSTAELVEWTLVLLKFVFELSLNLTNFKPV